MFKESGKLYKPNVENISITEVERFKKATGLILASDNDMPEVVNVVLFSAAEKSGIRNGDVIISIWGRLTGYLSLDTIMEMIMKSSSLEIILSIKRRIAIFTSGKQGKSLNDIGLSLKIQEDGLVVLAVERGSEAAQSGLAEGDIITDIDGVSVRYMPFNAAKIKISDSLLSGNLSLNIERDLALWRKEI